MTGSQGDLKPCQLNDSWRKWEHTAWRRETWGPQGMASHSWLVATCEKEQAYSELPTVWYKMQTSGKRIWAQFRWFLFFVIIKCFWEICFNDKNSTCSLLKKYLNNNKTYKVESKSLPLFSCSPSLVHIHSLECPPSPPPFLPLRRHTCYLYIHAYHMCTENFAYFCLIKK